MRHALHHALLEACVDGMVQPLQHGRLLAAHRRAARRTGRRSGARVILPVDGHQEPVEQIPRHLPARRVEIERMAVAQGPVELTLQGMEHDVDLVDDRDGAAPVLEHLHRACSLRLEKGLVKAHLGRHFEAEELSRLLAERHVHARVLPRVEQVEQLEQLEQEGLDRRGRRDHDGALLDREVRGEQQVLVHHGAPVEGEGGHRLAQRAGAEDAAHHLQRKAQQRCGHHLHHKLRAISEHESEKRRDRRGLALAHEHLVAHRAARAGAAHELI